VAIDSIRCLKLALDNKLSGAIIEPAAYFQKHPPKQIEDRTARELVEQFIARYGQRPAVPAKQRKPVTV
jgi:myo-inositol-1-phosphate synthase